MSGLQISDCVLVRYEYLYPVSTNIYKSLVFTKALSLELGYLVSTVGRLRQQLARGEASLALVGAGHGAGGLRHGGTRRWMTAWSQLSLWLVAGGHGAGGLRHGGTRRWMTAWSRLSRWLVAGVGGWSSLVLWSSGWQSSPQEVHHVGRHQI